VQVETWWLLGDKTEFKVPENYGSEKRGGRQGTLAALTVRHTINV
jgi:hypothetical protein